MTDAVLSVMDGPSDAASAVTGGTPSTVYVHVSSAILAALNGTVALELSTTAGFTDPNGNTVTGYTAGSSVVEAYGLDNTADADTNLSIDTVAGDDDINNVESSSVDVTIDNVDADAATIVVTLSDGNVAHDKVVTLNGDGSSAYTANFINVGDMDEGALTVSAVVTDDAGSQADVEKDDITLDTIADTGADLDASFVDDWSDNDPVGVINHDEAEEGAIFVAGFGETDLAAVTATVTDGAHTLTLLASPPDLANFVPPVLAITTADFNGPLTLRFSDDPDPDNAGATVAELTAVPVAPGTDVGGETHIVNFDPTDLSVVAAGVQLNTLFGQGEFYVQMFDDQGDSVLSQLNSGPVSVSVSVTDTSGNTDIVAPADTAVLDQSADVDSNLTLTLADTVINAAEDATVGMTLTGIDPGNTVEISLAHDSDVGEDGPVDGANVVTAVYDSGDKVGRRRHGPHRRTDPRPRRGHRPGRERGVCRG